MRSKALRRTCVCSMFAALICVCSPIAIPIGPVPVSLSLLPILLCSALLGPLGALTSTGAFLLLGAIGLPVFGGGMGGIGVLIGPTGGYIWSYLPISLICGALYRIIWKQFEQWMARLFAGFAVGGVGVIVCYFVGTLQYAIVADVSFLAALTVCVLPFVFFDILKLILVSILNERIRRISAFEKIFTDLL